MPFKLSVFFQGSNPQSSWYAHLKRKPEGFEKKINVIAREFSVVNDARLIHEGQSYYRRL